MYLVRKITTNQPEYLKSERYQNISTTVSDIDVIADDSGKKYVFGGTLIDVDGKIVTIKRTGSSGSYTYTFSSNPVGILFDTIDVTYGPQAGARMIDGSVNAERLTGDHIVEAIKQIATKMPFIKFFVDDELIIVE